MVARVTGRGEFFNRGDPIPEHSTLSVEGVEEPFVGRMHFETLLSAALSERDRRRNDQASHQLWHQRTLTCFVFEWEFLFDNRPIPLCSISVCRTKVIHHSARMM